MRVIRRSLVKVYREYSKSGIQYALIGGLEWTFVRVLSINNNVYNRVVPKYYRWRSSNDVYQFLCPPDPFKIEWVDPDEIKFLTGRSGEHYNRRLLFGAVMNGEWDTTGISFQKTDTFRSIKQRFEHDVPWLETPLGEKIIENTVKANNQYHKRVRSDVLSSFEYIDELYHTIHNEGYKSQSELLNISDRNDGLYLDELDEITVDIGRNGDLLFVDGIHRLSIAKLLNIKQIPVVFLVRHQKWMEYRDEQCQNNSPIEDHPNLRDLK